MLATNYGTTADSCALVGLKSGFQGEGGEKLIRQNYGLRKKVDLLPFFRNIFFS